MVMVMMVMVTVSVAAAVVFSKCFPCAKMSPPFFLYLNSENTDKKVLSVFVFISYVCTPTSFPCFLPRAHALSSLQCWSSLTHLICLWDWILLIDSGRSISTAFPPRALISSYHWIFIKWIDKQTCPGETWVVYVQITGQMHDGKDSIVKGWQCISQQPGAKAYLTPCCNRASLYSFPSDSKGGVQGCSAGTGLGDLPGPVCLLCLAQDFGFVELFLLLSSSVYFTKKLKVII